MRTRLNNSGFTLIELLIICPILMAIIAFMMNYLFAQYGQLTQQQAQVNLQVEAQAITFSIQDDAFFANAFVSTLNSNLSDSYAPSGGWASSTNPTVFIISTPALTADHRSSTRQPVYINTFGCSPQSTLQQNDVLYNNIIYFVSGTNLYKRIVTAPSGTSTCGTSYQKQTCPSGHTSSNCGQDLLMTNQLSSFTATYYDANHNVVTTPEQATMVKLSLQLVDQAYAQNVYGNSSLTVRKINE